MRKRSDVRDVKDIRKNHFLMNTKSLAIHFFTWEGVPRPKDDIARAVCLYPTDTNALKTVIGDLAKAAGVVFFLSLLYFPRSLVSESRDRGREIPYARVVQYHEH